MIIESKMENNLIESMVDTARHNGTLTVIKEGEFIVEYDSVRVIDSNNNKHFATYCPYDYEGERIDKRIRNKIHKKFIEKYSYKDIRNIIEKDYQEKVNKVNKAENTKYILENLINDELSTLQPYGTIDIKANNNLIEYYINFKRSYNINLDIYLSDKEGLFNVYYNYEKSLIDIEGIKMIVNDIINISEKQIQEEKEKQEQEFKERNIANKRLEIARQIQQGKIAIIKLKSGYQCLRGNIRYSVGTGKSGKYYKLNGIYAIVEYLEKKDINEYIFIDNDDTFHLTNKYLKSLNYNKIA